MPRFELHPDLAVPEDERARVSVAVFEALRDGGDLSPYFTEDYLLEGSPLQVALLPQGPVGNQQALANMERNYPDAVVRLQEVVVSPSGRVMSVLAVLPGEGLHGLVVYIVSDIADGKFTRTRAFAELVEAREALTE